MSSSCRNFVEIVARDWSHRTRIEVETLLLPGIPSMNVDRVNQFVLHSSSILPIVSAMHEFLSSCVERLLSKRALSYNDGTRRLS